MIRLAVLATLKVQSLNSKKIGTAEYKKFPLISKVQLLNIRYWLDYEVLGSIVTKYSVEVKTPSSRMK